MVANEKADEGPGLRLILAGLRALHPDDLAFAEAAMAPFDAILAATRNAGAAA